MIGRTVRSKEQHSADPSKAMKEAAFPGESQPHSAFQPFCLGKLINYARNAKGIPPESLRRLGVACLHPDEMQRNGCKVMDIGVLKDLKSSNYVVASLWPLEVVDKGFIALDDRSTLALGLD
ncbi:hypothetical protein FGB62_182g141 [Gracilaria domingensis]|nr:hypothetical protein FGB62_182g141 [Gracilaria domingensis]